MKRIIILFCLFNICANSQIKNIEQKLDSIVSEADLLYRHEKAAWHGTDILLNNKELMKNYGGYVVYFENENTIITYLNKNNKKVLAEFIFDSSNLINPKKESYEGKELTKSEKKLFEIKNIISGQLSNPKYNLRIPKNCNPNLILIEGKDIYKLYVVMGPKINNVIPFGNDYLFKANSKGKITEWKKFHKTFIPTSTQNNGDKNIESVIHSHLKMTPLITATDICNFRLYNSNNSLSNFIVTSTALNKIFSYDLKSNSIQTIKE